MTLYDSSGTHHVIKCLLPTKILPRVIITYGACARGGEEGEGRLGERIMDDNQRRALVVAAVDAKERAYSKYSKFPVGAALLCRDGTVITGKAISK